MVIIVRLDQIMADRKMSLNELAQTVEIIKYEFAKGQLRINMGNDILKIIKPFRREGEFVYGYLSESG